MRSLILCLLIVLGFTAPAHASDPFARREFLPKDSKYPGDEIDLSRMRNLIELSDSSIVAYGFSKSVATIDRGFHYVANFRHGGKFWTAKIPKNAGKKATFQFQTLSSLKSKGIPEPVLEWLRIGHVQMRFELSSPIELRTQDTSEKPEHASVTDFVYSFNALKSLGNPNRGFSATGDGLHDGYGTANNLMSMMESAAYFRKLGLNVEQYPMNLEPGDVSKMLEYYVARSTSAAESEVYNSAKNSCVTNLMEGVYSVVKNAHVLWIGRFWRNWRLLRGNSKFENNPRAVVALLTKQGYINPAQQLPNVEVEFKDLLPAVACKDVLKKAK